MRRLLGEGAVGSDGKIVVLKVPSGQRIVLTESDSPGLTSMTLRVENLAVTEALLGSNIVEACGTTLRFVEGPPA
jgi:hypothetical protein